MLKKQTTEGLKMNTTIKDLISLVNCIENKHKREFIFNLVNYTCKANIGFLLVHFKLL